MIELTEQQIERVANKLESLGIYYKPLQEDLLDHICTEIEIEIHKNQSFELALEMSLAKFTEEEVAFKQLQKQTLKEVSRPIRRKRKRKIVGLSTVLASLFFFFGLVVQANEKPDIYPVKFVQKIEFDNQNKQTIFALQKSQEVEATATGVVLEVSEVNHSILIKHKNGYATFYKNLDKILVSEGDEVKKSTKIAWVQVQDRHTKLLFYQIIKNGKFVY